MQVRIKFSADLVIEADNLAEVRNKFEGMTLWSEDAKDCGVEYSETLLIEDADTYEDLMADYHNAGVPHASYAEMAELNEYECPECGHIFKQGEYNYNYDTGCLDFECPECGWEGRK